MNLKGLYEELFSRADWAPTQSEDAKSRVKRFINQAYFQLSQEAPFLFFEDTVHFATKPDFKPTDTADTLSVAPTDPWILVRSATLGTYTAWDSSGNWDGRILRIEDSSGQVHRHRIRTLTQKTGYNGPQGVGTYEVFSLERPWHNTSATGLTYRVFTDDYYLPDDVIEVNSIRLAEANQSWPLDILGQLEAERFALHDDSSNVGAGVPRTAFRGSHRQIDAPSIAPTLTLGGELGTQWAGPDPAGEFEYCFTYCWGYRDEEYQNQGPQGPLTADQTLSGRREPLWESAPSPVVSAIATNAQGTGPGVGGAITITTPNIDFMQGFGRAADLRYRLSGWWKRIYRRRITVDTDSYTVGPLTNVEPGAEQQGTPDTPFLLFAIPGHQTAITDTGEIIPDFHRRLREVHGYQALTLYPRPDKRYDVDVRCIRRPAELRDDNDVPRIHRDAMDVLIHRALAYLYEAQGDIELADRSLSRFREDLLTLTKRYGDLRYPEAVLMKRPARAGKLAESRKPFRRWYNLP